MSSTPELTTERIKSLYAQFRAADPWDPWTRSYRAVAAHFQALDSAAFALPANQERLWKARDVSGVGPGEAVGVEGAYTDPEIVQALDDLRRHRWPDEPNTRARAIQDAWGRILGMVTPKHSAHRPQAKLFRAFATLLPRHLHTGFSFEAHRNIARMLLGSRKVQQIEGAVLCRARLRAALDEEQDLDEDIHRAQFCWWLHENEAAISRGDTPAIEVPAGPEEPEAAPAPIDLWPVSKQRKGFAVNGGYVEALRAVVGVAEQGATPDDIVESLRSDGEWSQVSPKRCRQLFNRVRWFGFLEHRDGLWFPSQDGERLLLEDPPEVLVERLIVRVFGLAHALRLLKAGSRTRRQLIDALQALYPRWTTQMAPSMLISWLESVGLIDRSSGSQRALSDYGRAWEARLPEMLPVPDPSVSEGEDDEEALDGPEAVSAAGPWPGLGEMTDAFRTDDRARRLVFTDGQIRALHVAWHCHPRKRFVLLSGLSGTGKTALLTTYARLYLRQLGLDEKRHLSLVPVSPDWRDPSGLLGYFNALHSDPTFQAEPALRLVVAAARNPSLPYFLILDEMNLARVELYFAPFLSAMESGRELPLHAHDEVVNGVPPTIPWPTNLFVGGTVNMDETTHPFSDKVLDRAFTMEFWDVDLDAFLAGRGQRHTVAEDLLRDIHGELRRVRRHFGYRTAGEVLDFLDHAAAIGAGDDVGVLDDAVFAKVLPRLRGEESPQLHEVLAAVRDRCAQRGLARCAAKLDEMRERLRTTGMTRFWA